MTPLQLEILLHYYGCANEYRNGDLSAPAVQEAIMWFCGKAGLMETAHNRAHPDATLRLTEKGRFFVEYICATPLPVAKWIMPDRKP